MKSGLVLLIFATFLLMGCSNKQMYNAIQQNRKVECDKMPDIQREECLAAYQKDYEEYQRQRDGVIQKTSK